MSSTHRSPPDGVFFSLPQLEALMKWGRARPLGFNVHIATDHEDAPEMAELFRHDRMSPVWFINATVAGTVVFGRASGFGLEAANIEEALARVLELERTVQQRRT